MTAGTMLDLFEKMLEYFRGESVETVIYKPVPYIYHLAPSEEDLYALFVCNAKLVRRDITAALDPREAAFQERRERAVKKALKNGIEVSESRDYASFMAIAGEILKSKYGTHPTHTAAEIERLSGLFPENIRLFVATKGSVLLAGTIIYESAKVAHAQYIAANDEGKATGALDLVFERLIRDRYREKRYFDFGISNEEGGRYLNRGLMEYKEGFGARAVAHDFYEIETGGAA